jgi:hypothetical protein
MDFMTSEHPMDVRFHVIWMFVFGRSMVRTFVRSMIVRITSSLDVQARKMDAIKTSNRRKCASRVSKLRFKIPHLELII